MDISWAVLVFLAVFAALGRVNDLEACTALADLLCFTSLLHLALLGIRALRTPRHRTSTIFFPAALVCRLLPASALRPRSRSFAGFASHASQNPQSDPTLTARRSKPRCCCGDLALLWQASGELLKSSILRSLVSLWYLYGIFMVSLW